MDKRAKGERDGDSMAEMIIGLLGITLPGTLPLYGSLLTQLEAEVS